jgi:hypothetical protein
MKITKDKIEVSKYEILATIVFVLWLIGAYFMVTK